MRQRLLAPLAAVAALGPLSAWPGLAGAQEQLVDGVAAQVGNRIVLISEVLRSVRAHEAALREAGAPEREIAKLRAEGLERLIEARLIDKVVANNELYAEEEEIDRTIDTIAKDHGLTVQQLRASVAFQGMTYDEYREEIKRELERRNVVHAVVGREIEVEEEDVEKLYRERFADQPDGGDMIHVRQLLVTFGGQSQRDQATACAETQAARERIRAGESFFDVAREVSEVAPLDGGDIGWLHRDNIAAWMSDALESLAPGDTTDVIVLPFGCSLLQLVEIKTYRPVTYENAREALAQEAFERALESGYREWMEELRQDTYIDRRGYFADAAKLGEQTFPVQPDPPARPFDP